MEKEGSDGPDEARRKARFTPCVLHALQVEERLVNDEYKVWKKNTPFLCAHSALLRRCVTLRVQL